MISSKRTVFISGATSGIGLATAHALDQQGWRVFAGGLPTDDFSALRAEASPNLQVVPLDITDAESVRTFAEQCTRELATEGLHGLVNNAGIQIPSPLETLPLDALRQQLEVNLIGHLRVIQAFLPLLRTAQPARIVNVSSLMGKVAMPLLGAYSLSKHALEGLSDTLRLELAPFGIHTALIEPGAIQTPMTSGMGDLLERAEARAPEALRALYAPLFARMKEALRVQNAHALPVAEVTKAILHALNSPKPRARYAIGASTQGLMLMRRLAPEEVGDAILKRALRLP